MRVCMIVYSFYEADTRVIMYADALVERGDQVDVISLRRKGQRPYDTINGVRVYRIQERTVNERGRLSYLRRILTFLVNSAIFLTKVHLKRRYDVIHVHSVPDFEVFAALIPKILGAKIILDIHDIVPEFYASKFNMGHKSFFYRLLILAEKVAASFSDHVIISNHIWQKTLTSRSVNYEKCIVILNYPNNSIFFKRKPSKEDDRFIIMYPGTLNWHQGLDIAIKAFAIIKDQAPNAYFYIYGQGNSKNILRELITQLKLEGRVFLKDFLPVGKIASIMASSDLGIIPKRNDSFGGEAFSTKTLEFMMLGVPIIVSRTRIDQYYFDDSIVKFFRPEDEKDLAEAMLLLINNPVLRNNLAENAMKFVSKNNWNVKKDIYLHLVDSLVGAK